MPGSWQYVRDSRTGRGALSALSAIDLNDEVEARDGARFDVVDRRAAAACVALARRWPRSGFDSDL